MKGDMKGKDLGYWICSNWVAYTTDTGVGLLVITAYTALVTSCSSVAKRCSVYYFAIDHDTL